MIPTRILTTVLVAGALAVAGCGSSDDSSSSSSPASTPAASTPATSAPAASSSSSGGTVAVSMKNVQFDPKAITVEVGQKIVWTNDDGFDHNVVADSGADFQSSNFGQGKTYEFTPDKAGTIKYECTIHPGMVGTITVK